MIKLELLPRARGSQKLGWAPRGRTEMPNQIRRVGVVGLGAMGMGIAQSLLRAGFEVHACDVRPEAVAKITEAGAHGADTPAALGSRVEALVIVVVNAQKTDAVPLLATEVRTMPRSSRFFQ